MSINIYRNERIQRKRFKTSRIHDDSHDLPVFVDSSTSKSPSVPPEMQNTVECNAFGSELSEWHAEFEHQPCRDEQPSETAYDVGQNIALKFTEEVTESGITEDCSWVLRTVLEANNYRLVVSGCNTYLHSYTQKNDELLLWQSFSPDQNG